MILRPAERRVWIRQIVLDECEEEPYSRLREGGKYVDELTVLPDGSVIVVEYAEWPTAHEGVQVLETLTKLAKMHVEVAAVVVVAKRGFDKRDKGLIAQALRTKCSRRGIPVFLKRSGQNLTVRSTKFTIVDP